MALEFNTVTLPPHPGTLGALSWKPGSHGNGFIIPVVSGLWIKLALMGWPRALPAFITDRKMSFEFQMRNLQMRFQKVQFYLYFWPHGTPAYPALLSAQSSRDWTVPCAGSSQQVAPPLRNMLRSNICMLPLMPFSLTSSLRSVIGFHR